MKKILKGLLLAALIIARQTYSAESVKLPEPQIKGGTPINEAIQARRSVREFQEIPLSLQELSQLCWSAQGVTDPKSGKRSAPSAGALYPLKLYVLVKEKGVSGLNSGIYLYLPETHSLKLIQAGDLSSELAKSALSQTWMKTAPISFIFNGDPSRTRAKYKERAWQYIYLEAGMSAENLMLEASALNLGGCPVGAFYNDKVKELLKISSEEEPLLIMPIGKPK